MPGVELPCESTVNNILKKHGTVTPRKKNRRRIINKYPVFDPQLPNLPWSTDFKGKFRMGSYESCNPLTIADSYSRYLFAIHGLEFCRAEDRKPIFEKVYREWGMPEPMHGDLSIDLTTVRPSERPTVCADSAASGQSTTKCGHVRYWV